VLRSNCAEKDGYRDVAIELPWEILWIVKRIWCEEWRRRKLWVKKPGSDITC
jgi:hypothetical protein